MKQLFSLSFLCTLFGTYFLLVPSTLVCMHSKEHLPVPAKKLAGCMIITQAVLHGNSIAKLSPLKETPLPNDTLLKPKKYKDKIILPPLNVSSLKVVSKSASDVTPSNVKISLASQKKPLANLFPHSQERSQSPLLVSTTTSVCSLVRRLEEEAETEEAIQQKPSAVKNVLALFHAGTFETDDETPCSLDSQSSCESPEEDSPFSPRKRITGYKK